MSKEIKFKITQDIKDWIESNATVLSKNGKKYYALPIFEIDNNDPLLVSKYQFHDDLNKFIESNDLTLVGQSRIHE